MFGGLDSAGGSRLVYATHDGSIVTFDVDTGAILDHCAVFPAGPRTLHVAGVMAANDGVWLCDTQHRRVRRVLSDGWQAALVGGLPTPGVDHQDDPGVMWEPNALVRIGDELVVACGGFDMEFGVQRFDLTSDDDRSPAFLGALDRTEGWKRAQGLAFVDGLLWVAETEAHRICRHRPDGTAVDAVQPHPDLGRPFRLSPHADGVLMTRAPDEDGDFDRCGVALLDADAKFVRWLVRAGEGHGETTCPIDIATLPDGRFAVLDLPLGQPPDVRVRVFQRDGTLQRTLLDETSDLHEALSLYFRRVLDQKDESDADALLRRARVHHFNAGKTGEHLDAAHELYRAALDADAGRFAAHFGLAELLAADRANPAAAEMVLETAMQAGAPAQMVLPRLADCHRARGDLAGAIRLRQQCVEGVPLPEDYHDQLELLANDILEQAGESID